MVGFIVKRVYLQNVMCAVKLYHQLTSSEQQQHQQQRAAAAPGSSQ
jgi:hypothetical protein